jgi:hypothetical protein
MSPFDVITTFQQLRLQINAPVFTKTTFFCLNVIRISVLWSKSRHIAQIGSEAHQPTTPQIRAHSHGIKRSEREVHTSLHVIPRLIFRKPLHIRLYSWRCVYLSLYYNFQQTDRHGLLTVRATNWPDRWPTVRLCRRILSHGTTARSDRKQRVLNPRTVSWKPFTVQRHTNHLTVDMPFFFLLRICCN